MSILVLVKNNTIERVGLPNTGVLSNGDAVSNYKNLPEETLKEEGWLPLEDSPPTFDSETEEIIPTGFDILPDKVVRTYEVVSLPELGPDPDREAQDEFVSRVQEVYDTAPAGPVKQLAAALLGIDGQSQAVARPRP